MNEDSFKSQTSWCMSGVLATVGWGEKTSSLRSADFSPGKPRVKNTNRKIGRGNIDTRNLNIFLFLIMRQFLNIFSFDYRGPPVCFRICPHVPFSSLTGHFNAHIGFCTLVSVPQILSSGQEQSRVPSISVRLGKWPSGPNFSLLFVCFFFPYRLCVYFTHVSCISLEMNTKILGWEPWNN